MDRQLSRQKVRLKISIMKTNTLFPVHFSILIQLKTTKTPVFVFITIISNSAAVCDDGGTLDSGNKYKFRLGIQTYS